MKSALFVHAQRERRRGWQCEKSLKALTDGAMAVCVQGIGALLAFLVQLVFARVLGPTEYGLFAYFFALAVMIGVWSRLGSDLVVQRIGGQAMASSRLHEMKAVLHHSQVVTIVGSTAGAILIGALAVGTGLVSQRIWLPALGSLLVVATGIAGVRQAALLALGRSIAALGPDLVLKPAIVLATMGIALWSGLSVSAESALGIVVVGGTVAILVSGLLIARATVGAQSTESLGPNASRWTKLGLTLMFAHASYILFFQSDTLVLGYIMGPDSIGSYQVAKQISQVGLFAMISIQHVFAARMSALVSLHDWKKVRELYFGITRFGAIFAGTVLLTWWLVGDRVIELFGPGYNNAYATTLIMLSFQLIVAIVGPIGMFAVMSGRQRAVSIAYAGASLVILGGLPVTAVHWGINGAAVIHGSASVFCVALLVVSVWRSTPIDRATRIAGG